MKKKYEKMLADAKKKTAEMVDKAKKDMDLYQKEKMKKAFEIQ